MNKSHILFLTAVIALLTVFPQQSSLGDFAEQSDIGNPIHTGRATYDSDKQEYTIEAAGTNMWASRDEFHFVWRRLTGNFILTTNTAFVGKGVEPHRKWDGWCARVSTPIHRTQSLSFTVTGLHRCSFADRKAPQRRK